MRKLDEKEAKLRKIAKNGKKPKKFLKQIF